MIKLMGFVPWFEVSAESTMIQLSYIHLNVFYIEFDT